MQTTVFHNKKTCTIPICIYDPVWFFSTSPLLARWCAFQLQPNGPPLEISTLSLSMPPCYVLTIVLCKYLAEFFLGFTVFDYFLFTFPTRQLPEAQNWVSWHLAVCSGYTQNPLSTCTCIQSITSLRERGVHFLFLSLNFLKTLANKYSLMMMK